MFNTIILLLLFLSFSPGGETASFRIVNKCRHTIWPGLLSGATSPPPPTTGFTLRPGKSRTLTIPHSWSGRVWARTHCSLSSTFACLTADCASGKVACGGAGAIPPATLIEFTLNGAGGLDFYDVSLVDGYNLPVLVFPVDGKRNGNGDGDCSPTGCLIDLNLACPKELGVFSNGSSSRADVSIACKSGCEAFGKPEYCCSEGFNTPETCRPSEYAVYFKEACPRAYSYAYDDKTSTFTCVSDEYTIIFCPPPYTSQKLLGARRMAGELPLVNRSMMYLRSTSTKASTGLIIPQLIGAGLIVSSLIWELILHILY